MARKFTKFFRVLPIFLIIFLLGCNVPSGVVVEVEIADDPDKRSQGLMFREHLDEKQGMYFIFEDSGTYSFWMKNTLIPLDLIFISEDLKVVDIKKNFQPCEGDCSIYRSNAVSKNVLEVNAGFANRNNIQIGDKVEYDGTYVYFGKR